MDHQISEFVSESNLTKEDEQTIRIQRRPKMNEQHKIHSPITLQQANPRFSFTNKLVIILTSIGTILFALFAVAIVIQMVSYFIINFQDYCHTRSRGKASSYRKNEVGIIL